MELVIWYKTKKTICCYNTKYYDAHKLRPYSTFEKNVYKTSSLVIGSFLTRIYKKITMTQKKVFYKTRQI